MEKIKIGVQLYSIRDYTEKDFFGALEQVAAIGYDAVEFAGFGGIPADEMKKKLDELGLDPVSTHTGIEQILPETIDATIAYLKVLGTRYLALPSLPEEYRAEAPTFAEKAKVIAAAAAKLKENGITTLYHNHDFEYIKVGDKFALDLLYEAVPDLETEFDTCWVKFAGESPVAYIEKYSGRTPVVHLKDFVCKELRNRDGFEFRPVGHGVQDFPSIIEASKKSGAKAFIVEQDMSYGMTSLEAIRQSREYLKSLGL